MRLTIRQIEIAGITLYPDGSWTKQMARSLTDHRHGFLGVARYLIVDRDTEFQALCSYIDGMTDTDVLLLPPKSPNLNADLERFMRSVKSECLNRMIFFGPGSLESAPKKFSAHYHRERNHQGLGDRIITPSEGIGQEIGDVQCRERLGSMLRYYYREAA